MQQLSTTDLIAKINYVISQIQAFFGNLVQRDEKHANLIITWLNHYIKYLSNENSFLQRKTYKKYVYGQIINVSFGYNLGHELGGIHYAVVLNKNDSPSCSDLVVIPLSSKDKELKVTDTRLDIGSVFIDLIKNKKDDIDDKISDIFKKFNKDTLSQNKTVLQEAVRLSELSEKIDIELKNMENGSIISTGQIRSISKIRILNPIIKDDPIDNIVLPSEIMRKIQEKLHQIIGQ